MFMTQIWTPVKQVVSANVHNIFAAQNEMGQGFSKTYHPDSNTFEVYAKLYSEYEKLTKFTEQIYQ